MTVGEKIQKYRKDLDLSQEELGQKLLVSRQTISLWEKDQTVPTIDNLIRLRETFGVSVDEILGFETIEQNNEILWLNFKSLLTPLLDQMVSGEGLSAYKLIKNVSQDKTRLSATIRLYPVYAVESFEIEITLEDEEVTVE